ncbi:Uncharacterized protein YpbB [Halobacillus karajensis]|uniref:helix-turn-helix domain-containing protein n=1 Tax=Halobacillus karajensis TaxID=195088 RepID=UPI0008A80EC5|nr:helix-turn-helix domain-containing protein [Halobacillus karajensis]SEH82027.1 Uncharacterized protein YpbB [Halobacillus karajensis]
MFHHLILQCIDKFRGERTTSGIYNLLTGKRSSQTMQDAKGYQVDDFFGIMPDLRRKQLDAHIHPLIQEGLIVVNDQSFPTLTSSGKDALYSYKGPKIQYFKGMVWHEVIPSFWRRVYLLIQMMANRKAGIKHYYPIVDDYQAQRWARLVYHKFQHKLPRLIQSLYEEIHTLLENHSVIEANLYVHRLTGGKVIGLTVEQLKEMYGMNDVDVQLHLEHTHYYLFLEAKKDKESYPVLHLCTKGLDVTYLITQSARKTYQYFMQGLSIDEIVTLRKLKKSTIQDHIVEAALIIPDFSIASFLSDYDVDDINNMALAMDTQKLKQIHEAFNGKYNYFELRLALASGQHRIEGRNSTT